MLTDTDIDRLLGREIVIEPFDERCLTPMGYDLRIGDFVYSLSRGMLSSDSSGEFCIEPNETVLILTKEYVWVSDQIAGTLHSKVSLVSRGFSHISTTLDPGWNGPLLIATSNRSAKRLALCLDQLFVTVVFHRTISHATRPHKRPPGRRDILLELIQNPSDENRQELERKQQDLIHKVGAILGSMDAQTQFAEKVESANRPAISKTIDAMRQRAKAKGVYYGLVGVHVSLLALIVLLPLYFDSWIKPAFPGMLAGVNVDSQFFAGALGATVVILVSLITLMRRK